MLRSRAVTVCRNIQVQAKRHIAVTTVLAKQDPIQQLFLNAIKEYDSISKSTGKIPDLGEKEEAFFNKELDRIAKMYKVPSEDEMKKFPQFKWKDVPFDNLSPDVSEEAKLELQIPEDVMMHEYKSLRDETEE